MTDTDKQAAIADVLQRLKAATDRYKATMKQLEGFDRIIARVKQSPIPVTSWQIAVDHPDMRYEGGLKIGDPAPPILPQRWLSGDQIIELIKEKKASAAEREAAREALTELGVDIQQLAS